MAAPITTDQLAEAARKLGQDGYRWTARQLYYAVCAAVEQPPPSATRGMVGCGAILIVCAGLVVRIRPYVPSIVLLSLGALMLAAAPYNAWIERRRAQARALLSRPLACSWDGFVRGPLERARRERPEALPGMVDSFAAGLAGGDGAAGEPHPQAAEVAAGSAVAEPGPGTLIAADRAETAALLRANTARLPAGTAVAGSWDAEPDLGKRVRDRKVVAIHDADPTGCALPLRLREAGAVEVVDAGLRPPRSPAGLQLIEGAPARLPTGLETDLSADELGWLRSGRRLELATLDPQRVLGLVAAAAEGHPAWGDAVQTPAR
ncbi:MAG TPA: hypothetical protein VEK76_00850 [Candidatus Binatia bacterium]|nr:hypothetical protein [Candidatus Binatia bacterium]